MNNNINNNTESGNGNNGNRGKFSDRLKKMRRDRLLKRRNSNFTDTEEDSVIKRGGRNVLKILLALPSVIYSNIKYGKNVNDDLKVINNDVNSNLNYYNNIDNVVDNAVLETSEQKETARRIKVNKIRDMDVSLLKKQKELYVTQQKKQRETNPQDIIYTTSLGIDKTMPGGNDNKVNETELKVINLQKEIIDLIKKKLIKNINDLEILQSELFLLKELTADDIYFKKCQEDIKEIKRLLSKVKVLKEKYDYLKDNVDFEYMLEYEDDLLVDKILELKSICFSDDIRYTIDNYKILEEYKFLYLKIDKLQDDTIKYEEYKNNKAEELKERDIEFDKLKNDIYDVDRENDRYNSFVLEQELFLKKLENKISHIDSREEVTYRLKGFNQLLGNSFKYLGLLLLSPLKGLIPGIATQALITRNMVSNLYKNLELEENRKMVYEAIDYSNLLNNAISNLDDTSSLIDATLSDIISLKEKYKKDFCKYEHSVSGYKDAIKKINKMENAILGSKIKIANLQAKMKEKERKNSNKLKIVKKLNDSVNNSKKIA